MENRNSPPGCISFSECESNSRFFFLVLGLLSFFPGYLRGMHARENKPIKSPYSLITLLILCSKFNENMLGFCWRCGRNKDAQKEGNKVICNANVLQLFFYSGGSGGSGNFSPNTCTYKFSHGMNALQATLKMLVRWKILPREPLHNETTICTTVCTVIRAYVVEASERKKKHTKQNQPGDKLLNLLNIARSIHVQH